MGHMEKPYTSSQNSRSRAASEAAARCRVTLSGRMVPPGRSHLQTPIDRRLYILCSAILSISERLWVPSGQADHVEQMQSLGLVHQLTPTQPK